MKVCFFCILIFLVPTVAVAQTDPTMNLDRFVERLGESGKTSVPFTGYVVAMRDGKAFVSKGFGPQNPTADTKFAIGSVTKHIVGLELLRLEDQGKLSLEDPVSKHLAGLPKWAESITLRQLANHTAGFANYTAMPGFEPVKYKNIGLSEILAMTAEKSPTHPAGEKWAYSNTHYYLLGVVIEKVTGSPYMSAVKQDLFSSPELTNVDSYANVDLIQGTEPSVVDGKTLSVDAKMPHRSGPSAAGEIAMSGNEIAAWGLVVAGMKKTRLERFSKGSTIRPNYGLGIFTSPKTTWINHGGGIDGFQTFFAVDPKTNSMVAVLGNCGSCGIPEIGAWTKSYLSSQVVPPLPEVAADPSSKLQKRMVGDYELDAASKDVAKGLGPAVVEMIGTATVSSADGQLFFKPVGQGPMRLMDGKDVLTGTSGISLIDIKPSKGLVKSFVLKQGPYRFRYTR